MNRRNKPLGRVENCQGSKIPTLTLHVVLYMSPPRGGGGGLVNLISQAPGLGLIFEKIRCQTWTTLTFVTHL